MKHIKKQSLSLNKKTIANLGKAALNSAKGGVTTLCQTTTLGCPTMDCPETSKCPFSEGVCDTFYCI